MNHYFAYGCNMDRQHMAALAPSARPLGLAVLHGHRLTFPRRCSEWAGGVASVEPADGGQVQGVLYAADDAALARLDEYEEVALGAYQRVQRQAVFAGRRLPAWVYLATPEAAGPFAPSSRYHAALVGALAVVGASPRYITALPRPQGG